MPHNLYRALEQKKHETGSFEGEEDRDELEQLMQASRYWALFDESGWEGRESTWIGFFKNILTINSYLEMTDRILSLASTSIRYGLHLTRCGYEVQFAGLSPEELHLVQHRMQQFDDSYINEIVEFDRRNLGSLLEEISRLDAESFDAVLAFGLFHRLMIEEDRSRLAEQIRRVLRPGKFLVLEFMPWPAFVLTALLGNWPFPQTSDRIDELWEAGLLVENPPLEQVGYYFAQVRDVSQFFTSKGFEEGDIYASEGIASWLSGSAWQQVRQQGRDMFDKVLEIIASASDDESTVGNSKHALYIGVKG